MTITTKVPSAPFALHHISLRLTKAIDRHTKSRLIVAWLDHQPPSEEYRLIVSYSKNHNREAMALISERGITVHRPDRMIKTFGLSADEIESAAFCILESLGPPPSPIEDGSLNEEIVARVRSFFEASSLGKTPFEIDVQRDVFTTKITVGARGLTEQQASDVAHAIGLVASGIMTTAPAETADETIDERQLWLPVDELKADTER